MGACFSEFLVAGASDGDGDGDDEYSTRAAPTTKVISASGQLHEYSIPTTVSGVLRSEISSLSSSSRSLALFLCNSDSLCYEELIPEMGSDEPLAKDQIYFSLPRSRLGRPLSASEMAALAVKASLALQKSGAAGSRSRVRNDRMTRISPVLEPTKSQIEDGLVLGRAAKGFEDESFQSPTPPPPARQYRTSYSSMRLKRAVWSFRIRLSTIQEGPESVH
ncbi:hypothetical protein SAY86_010584 [Trapa natans]|uniref:Uncharacterized protein n=1 Tax=Trapa natans TaxID=22666 RepID=A0AAN7R4C0_TRANT|nr:hypothetical protein SAY86_010584 [Trapa natans]